MTCRIFNVLVFLTNFRFYGIIDPLNFISFIFDIIVVAKLFACYYSDFTKRSLVVVRILQVPAWAVVHKSATKVCQSRRLVLCMCQLYIWVNVSQCRLERVIFSHLLLHFVIKIPTLLFPLLIRVSETVLSFPLSWILRHPWRWGGVKPSNRH